MPKANRVMIVGLDSLTLELVNKFRREGVLPNIEKVIDAGVVTESFPSLPPGTSTNWTTIATGANPGTHGVPSMSIHNPTNLGEKSSAFFSYHCKAERLWEAAERAGLRPIVLKYPGSWPPTVVRTGVQVEGFSDPAWNAIALAPRSVYTSRSVFQGSHKGRSTAPPPGTLPMRFKVELVNAEIAPHRWAKLPESPIVPLTAILPVKMTSGAEGQHYAVIYASSSAGYDRVALCWSRNYENRFAELEAGEWSQWIEDSAKIGDDEDGVAVSYRFKLVALSSDAGDFSLYRTPIFPAVGWTVPDELAATLHRNVGPFLELGGLHFCHWWGWFSEPEMQELFLDEFRYQVDWLSKAADQLLASPGWDLFITQWHGIDHIDHSYLSCFDPASPLHEDGVRMVRETYRLADQLVGSLLKYVDEDTLLVITSDHGHTAVHDQGLDENALLEQNGYLAFEEEPSVKSEHSGDRATSEDRIHGYNPTGRAIDWSRTKAAVIHDGFLFINLKGRYEHGIVPPEEYEELRRALITLLEDVRSKRNPNVRRYQFVWPKEDAELLGLYGDRVGDVVFYNKVSERGGHHGNFNASRDTDYGSLRACTMFMGPGVKRETVLPRAISLTDIVPTVCYLSRLPLPKNAEGRVVQEIIEDMEQG